MQIPVAQASNCLEPARQAHLSDTLERSPCSLAVFGRLEAQASRRTRAKAMVLPGDAGFTLASDASGHLPGRNQT